MARRYAYIVVEHGFGYAGGEKALAYWKEHRGLTAAATIDSYGAVGLQDRREWLSIKVPWAERQAAIEALTDEPWDEDDEPEVLPVFSTAREANEHIDEQTALVFYRL